MDASEGWSPLREPRRTSRSEQDSGQPHANAAPAPKPVPRGIGNGLIITAFTRLARVQTLSSIGDGMIAVALAGSIFFSIDPSAARWRVALYLILTIAPFAVVTPLLGPAIDRAKGGRRGMVVASLAGRAILAFLMVRHIDSLFLFPEAFGMLVLQKAYGVSKIALVPVVCPSEEELIQANSKLSLIGSFSGVVGGAIAVAISAIVGGGGATLLAFFVFLAGAVAALALPQVQIATERPDVTEKLQVRGANIVLAASAVGVIRAIVGFTTFLLAFHLRAGIDGIDRSEPGAAVGAALGTMQGVDVDGTPGPPSWHFLVAGLAVGGGAFLGARYAPMIRERVGEERIVFGALVTVSASALLGAWGGGIAGTALLAFGVGISAAVAKLGFDALVQRDAPRANHGAAFAKFEGRFQLLWAVGAFVPVVIPIGVRWGALLVAIAAGVAAVSYELGRRTDRVQKSSRMREAIRQRLPDAENEPTLSNVVAALLGRVRPDQRPLGVEISRHTMPHVRQADLTNNEQRSPAGEVGHAQQLDPTRVMPGSSAPIPKVAEPTRLWPDASPGHRAQDE